MSTATTIIATTLLKQQQNRVKGKRNLLKEYLQHKGEILLGYASFLSVVWFLLAPIFILLFVLSYFGLVGAVVLVCTCFLYNNLEDKMHPQGLVGRKWKAFHDLMGYLWTPFQNMMPVKVIKLKPDAFQPPRKFMFCYHPHGVLFLGASTIGNSFDKIFPDLNCYHLMSSICFLCPIFRQYALWNGCIPATKECASIAVSEHGVSLSVIPGGLAEMLESDATPRSLHDFEIKKCYHSDPRDDWSLEKKTIALYLRSRKGFIKVALQQGLDLVPVFTFGETDTYKQLRWGLSWRLKVSRFLTIPITWIWGKFFLFPYKTPLTVVYGEPIVVERDENPTNEAIEKLHKKYLDELCRLFEENKAKHGYKNSRLIIM